MIKNKDAEKRVVQKYDKLSRSEVTELFKDTRMCQSGIDDKDKKDQVPKIIQK